MDYKLEDLLDISLLQTLLDKLNLVYSFPSAIIDNEGKVLTAVAWQDICTKFHRINPRSEKECIKSDLYILEHLHEANPAVSYQCPHGMIDNAIPIIIEGKHLGNFFTGQFFLEKPDMQFFKKQAEVYGFNETAYMEAVMKVPVWTKEKLALYLDFIKEFIEIIAGIGLNQLREVEANKAIKEREEINRAIVQCTADWIWEIDENGKYTQCSDKVEGILGYTASEIIGKSPFDLMPQDETDRIKKLFQEIVEKKASIVDLENWNIHKDGHKVCLLTNGIPILDENANLVGYRGADKDITERKLSEDALQQTRLFLDNIIEHSPNSMWISDVYGTMIRMNQACRNHLHLKDDEVVGKYNIFKDNLLLEQGLMPLVRNVFEKGESVRFITSYNTANVNGLDLERTRSVVLEVYISPILNALGKVTNAIIQHIDITEQKLMESSILENENKYRNLIEFSPDAIFINQNNQVRLVNRACLDLFGATSEEELLGKNPVDLFHPDFHEIINQRVNILLKQGKPVPPNEEKIVRLDGKTVEVEVVAAPFQLGEEIVIHVILRDISERKKAEEIIRSIEQRWQFALEGAGNGVWDWNVPTNEVFYSHRWKEMLGYADEEVENTVEAWSSRIHPDDAKQCFDDLNRHFAKETPYYQNEHRMLCKDGTYKWILDSGKVIAWDSNEKPLRVIGTHQDIAERKQADIALAQSHDLLYKLSEQVPGVIYQYRLYPDGRSAFPYSSPGMYEIYEVTPEEVCKDASPVFTRIHPDDYDFIVETISESARNLTPYHSEFRVILPSQGLRWRKCDAKPELLEDGSTLWHGMISDITDRKIAEQELLKAKEKAEESDRLKSAFLANMSHEIRTPMNGILGFATLLKEPNLTGDEQQEYIRIIEKSGARMLNIIHDIIDIAKIESGQMEVTIAETNINGQIEFIYDFFKPEVEQKGILFLTSNGLASHHAIIKTDREKLYAILTNLVKNAIKNTKSGSIEIGYVKKGRYLEFFVKDTGTGIPKDRQQAIFHRFIQADTSNIRAHDGAGLGLSISKAYVEMLGGKIWVESEYGIGATFYFTIPYSVEREILNNFAGKVPGELVEKHMKALKILIAEDDDDSMILIKTLVKKVSREVIHVTTGVEAIEACHKNPDIDLVLMDIRMPDMNGHEAARQIRQFNKDVIIFAQTAYALAGDREKAIDSGCNDYITKPLKHNALMELIQKYFQ